MIVVSLLLILVAVTLLVLGLTGGSSNFLISSIVASLLAAVALVIGARQSASARRAAAESPADADLAAEAENFGPPPPTVDHRETVQFESPQPVFAAEDEFVQDTNYADEAYQAGRRDAVAGMTAGTSGARRDDEAEPVAEPIVEPEPDYERAAEAIHAARSDNPDEHSWRRADGTEPAGGGPAGHAEAAGLADEFAEPDEDDPADEPLPQSVRPADAVRIAQLDAEVLVVDGRPRYHLPDCPHLVGRLTEPVPVNEAVDLGFNPCGLCRPVDRLVAAAARH